MMSLHPAMLRAALLLLAASTIHAACPLDASPRSTVNLNTAAQFSVLAYATVTNTGKTTVGGLLGVSPGTAVTGSGSISYYCRPTPNGRATTEQAAEAKRDVTAAYLDAQSRQGAVILSPDIAEIGGQTFCPGLYKAGSAIFVTSGNVILSGDGVFIFQMASTFVVGTGLKIELQNGARAKNVFWQVGSSATFEVDTEVVGTVMAYAAISVKTRAKTTGRYFALVEAVTLDTADVVHPDCGTTLSELAGSSCSEDACSSSIIDIPVELCSVQCPNQ
jgi:hypothetical protein